MKNNKSRLIVEAQKLANKMGAEMGYLHLVACWHGLLIIPKRLKPARKS